jgi:hypothetical protein
MLINVFKDLLPWVRLKAQRRAQGRNRVDGSKETEFLRCADCALKVVYYFSLRGRY